MSLRAAREHSSDPLNPVFNRYQDELIQLRNQRTVVTDPDSKRISISSRSRLKYYDCFNQQQAEPITKGYELPREPDASWLRVWFRFGETGNRLIDRSTFDVHAFQHGNPKIVEGLDYGLFGGTIAILCDGRNDWFNAPELAQPQPSSGGGSGRITELTTGGYSVGTTIYPYSLVDNPTLFQKIDDNSGLYGYAGKVLEDGKIFFASKINGQLTKMETISAPLATPALEMADYRSADYNPTDYLAAISNWDVIKDWYRIWFTSTTAQPPVLQIYLNGTSLPLQVSTVTSGLPSTDIHDTIIAAGTSGASGYYNGIYQDYRFWRAVVNQSEVTNHNTNMISTSNIPYGYVFVIGGVVLNGVTSIYFDGSNQYINCSGDDTLWSQPLTKFAWSCWVYPKVMGGGGSNKDIVRHGSAGAGRFRCDLDTGIPGDAKFYIRNNADSADATARVDGMVINQWQQLIGSYDNSLGSANVRIYRNGVIGYQTAGHTETLADNNAPMTLGGNSSFLNGYIRDYRWWTNEAFNVDEALDFYENGVMPSTPDYWLPMDLGWGNPVDSISGTKVGTLTNGADWRYYVS